MWLVVQFNLLKFVADPSEVIAFLVLNNFKQIVKTWRKNLGDDVLYTQLQTALSVI